jgi:hypothetical protein
MGTMQALDSQQLKGQYLMTIISVSGLIGSGKNAVADYLIKEHGFVHGSFAGTLKDAVAPIFGWDREMLEGHTEESRKWRQEVDQWWAKRLNIPHLTPRWVLQYFGTNVCREHFNEDIWLASLENKLRTMKNKDVVISDARFVNELQMLKDAGATTICVQRGELPDWWSIAKKAQYNSQAAKTMKQLDIHPSEWDWVGWNFDETIMNNGTLEDLYGSVDAKVLALEVGP